MASNLIYPSSEQGDFIDIPTSLVDFLKPQHKVFFPQPRKRRDAPREIISYESVIGENPNISIYEIEHNDANLGREEYPFDNEDKNDKARVERVVKKAIKFIFKYESGEISGIKRTYMINTGTTPIRIDFKVHGHRTREQLYIKRPNVCRVAGKFLYDIISGVPKTKYGFNSAIVLEEGVDGNPLSRLDEDVILNSPQYKEGLVRAAVHADFLALQNDIRNPRNRIIDRNLRTILFDFNLMFCARSPNDGNYLLSDYIKESGFMTPELIDVYMDEHRLVVRRVEKKEKQLFKMAKLVGELFDNPRHTLNKKVERNYGMKSLVKYFEQKLDTYDRM